MKNLRPFILIFCIIFPISIEGLRRRCSNTGVLFPDKIFGSPIVIYGESLAKQIYLETDKELLFNVTFRVDCIFKGQDIPNRIEITEAGIKIGRTACQWLDPGKSYVVFLEKCGSNMNIYCPLDFQERVVDDMTYELLEKTCHLTRIPPLHSISNNCPNVSMIEFCPNDIDIKIMPKGKNLDYTNTNMKTSFNNTNQFYPQSNIKIPKKGILVDQIADKPNHHIGLSNLISAWLIILTVCVTMFI